MKGSSKYSKASGTGRSVPRTVIDSRPVTRSNSRSKKRVSPKVADISKKRAWDRVSNGACQAPPRSGSE